MKFCTYCGAELKEGLKFCPKCGKALRQPVAPVVDRQYYSDSYREENNSSLTATLKKVFRVWDITGSIVPMILWFVAFFFITLTPCFILRIYNYYDYWYDYTYLTLFEGFEYSSLAGYASFLFMLVIIEFAACLLYIIFVAKQNKVGRLITAILSIGTSLTLLLMAFCNELTIGTLLLGIMNSVILGFFLIGLIVSIAFKPQQRQKPKEVEQDY